MSADDPVTNVISLHDWRMEEASLINERITSTHRPSVKIKNYLSKIIHSFVNLMCISAMLPPTRLIHLISKRL